MVEFKQGQMKSYSASVEFSLNFDGKETPSVKVKEGEIVKYDGNIASYKKPDGFEVKGKTLSLRRAIVAGWLKYFDPVVSVSTETAVEPVSVSTETPAVEPVSVSTETPAVEPVSVSTETPAVEPVSVSTETPAVEPVIKDREFNDLKGGEFNKFLAKEAGPSKIIKERDQIVKYTDNGKRPTEFVKYDNKLEVAGDQVNVKDIESDDGRLMVSSSTSTTRTKKHKVEIKQAEDFGADSVTVMKSSKKNDESKKASNTFVIDNTTPSIFDGASIEEINRAKVKISSESQQGTVVRKVGSKGPMNIEDLDQDAKVVGKHVVKAESDDDAEVVKTLSDIEKEKTIEGITLKNEITGSSDKDIDVSVKTENTEPPIQEAPDYLSKLPEDWGKLHWTKKEKFIKQLEDPDFVRFIMMVETVKAIKVSCTERLKELEKQPS